MSNRDDSAIVRKAWITRRKNAAKKKQRSALAAMAAMSRKAGETRSTRTPTRREERAPVEPPKEESPKERLKAARAEAARLSAIAKQDKANARSGQKQWEEVWKRQAAKSSSEAAAAKREVARLQAKVKAGGKATTRLTDSQFWTLQSISFATERGTGTAFTIRNKSSAKALVRRGLLTKENGEWVLTDEGKRTLRKTQPK